MTVYLQMTDKGLSLVYSGCKPLYVDFTDTALQKRSQQGKQSQGLLRACQPKPGIRILDTTAGWGKDAAILAYCGSEVLMLERNPIMHALLEDGLKRLHQNNRIDLPIQLNLKQIEALHFLSSDEAKNFDVIYIDPMHPEREGTALVKKNLQALHTFVAPNQDTADLIIAALALRPKRVVLKWPAKKPPIEIDHFKPVGCITGKTINFYIY